MKKRSHIEILEYVCGILLGVMLVCILMQVIFRGLLNFGLTWTEEMARYSMIWLTFIGAIVSLKQGSHIAIKLLVRRLSSNWQKRLILISDLMVLFFLLTLLRVSIKLNFSPVIINQRTPTLRVSTAYLYSSITICTGIMIIISICFIVKDVKEIFIMKNERFK